MAGETNVTGSQIEIGKNELSGSYGDEPMILGSQDRQHSTVNFLEPITPGSKSVSLIDLSKKSVENKKKNKRGRPASKKRNASENSDCESDGEISILQRLEELEQSKKALEKRMTVLEGKLTKAEQENMLLKEQVMRLEQETDKVIKWKSEEEKKPQPQLLKTYSSVLKSKEGELLIKKIARNESKEAENIEKNIVITGIQKSGDSEESIKANDESKVNEILEVLELRRDQVDSQKRIRTINSSSNVIIVKMKEVQYTTKAIRNATNLRSDEKFKGLYVNKDKTRSERFDEKVARDEAKAKNSLLENLDSEGRRFGLDSNKRKYYYGVRNGEAVKVYPQQRN